MPNSSSDLTFGVHDVLVTADIVTKSVGPLLANGTSRYTYLGCYYDGGGRLLAKQYPNNDQNENGVCQTTCYNAGYTFAGTEYRKPPSTFHLLLLTFSRYPMLVW